VGIIMAVQYTNVFENRNKIYLTYYETETGEKKTAILDKIKNLSLYSPTKEDSEYKSLVGNISLKKMNFTSIKDYNEYLTQYKDVSGISVFGEFSLDKKWINSYYVNEPHFDYNLLNIGFFDIETTVSDGNPDPDNTPERITSIVLYATKSNTYYVLCDKKIDGKYFSEEEYAESNIKFYYFSPDLEGEYSMLKTFAYLINDLEKIDVLSAYFGNLFDFPYIYNRTAKVVFEYNKKHRDVKDKFSESNLSPFGVAYKTSRGNIYIQGIQLLDFFELYKKYSRGTPDSWKLDFIAEKELGVGKIKLEGGFMYVYEHDYEKYVYYNYIDVKRLKQLDDKLSFMNLHGELTYLAKQNFEDTLSPVRTWESILYGYLDKKNIQINPRKNNIKKKYLGGYTHDPILDFYNYILSFDLNSLYPHLIMMYYISPETLITEKEILKMFPNNETLIQLLDIKKELERISDEVPYDKKIVGQAYDKFADRIINREFDLSFLRDANITMSPSIEFFRKDEDAILPYFMKHFYDMRKIVKKEMLEIQDEIENLQKVKNKKKELDRLKGRFKELEKLDKIADVIVKMKEMAKRRSLKEQAFKILLNSAYGAFGNNYFSLFSLSLAKSITSGGRLAIRSLIKTIENKLRAFYKDISGMEWEGKDFFIYSDTDSCVGDTDIYVNENKMKIKDLYNMVGGDFSLNSEKIALKNVDLKSLSFNYDSEHIENKKIKYIWRHKVKKQMYKIKMNGKEVIVTADHSIIVYRNGKYINVKPSNILKTDKLIQIK
jgi:DNA polymerase elongation subunit (family B)